MIKNKKDHSGPQLHLQVLYIMGKARPCDLRQEYHISFPIQLLFNKNAIINVFLSIASRILAITVASSKQWLLFQKCFSYSKK